MGRCAVAALASALRTSAAHGQAYPVQNLAASPPMTQGEFAAYMKAGFDGWRKVAREGRIEAQ